MKKTGKRTKRAMKKTLVVLLILSICFSTMNMKAMAEEAPAVTQTEPDEGENGTQPSEGESGAQLVENRMRNNRDERCGVIYDDPKQRLQSKRSLYV